MIHAVDQSAPVMRNHPLNRGLVAWWIALPNQSRGVTWRDIAGRNHGTLTNMDPATDWIGPKGRPGGYGALDLDVSNDYVDLGSAVVLTSGQPFTIAWWERVTSAANAFPSRFSLDVAGSASYFLCGRTNNAGYQHLFFGPAGSTVSRASGAPSLASSVGIWRHWILTGTNPLSTTAADFAVYVDGVAYATSTAGAAGSVSTNRIGNEAALNPTDAALDDVRILNRAVSAAEARALYRETKAGHPDTLRWFKRARFAAATATIYTLTLEAGSYTLTGSNVTLKAQRRLTLGSGAFSLAGAALTLRAARKLSAQAGSYTLAGQPVGLNAQRRLTLNAGAYTLAGSAVTLRANRRLTLLAGSYSWTGLAVTLRYVTSAAGLPSETVRSRARRLTVKARQRRNTVRGRNR